MYEGPEFRHLRYFIAVAEECNINRAAVRLNVSQPSVSTQITRLEEGLKAELFIRSRAGSILTAAGRAFLPFAREMLEMRARSVKATSPDHSGIQLPLRLGYSPFVNHDLVEDALTGFCELVPDGKIEPYSDSTDRLVSLVLDGHLEAALVTLPILQHGLFKHRVCVEKLLICLRKDDALADHGSLPFLEVATRLRTFIARQHHASLYDNLMHRMEKGGLRVHPSEFVTAPSEMHFLVARGNGMGVALESTVLPPDLISKPIEGIPLKVATALICLEKQKRPVLPMLAYQLSKRCSKSEVPTYSLRKKPVERALPISGPFPRAILQA